MTPHSPHQALNVPLSERVDYLMVIASMAGADVVLAREETATLKQLCQELALPEKETAAVLNASQGSTASVVRHLDALKASPLRFALLADCLAMAYADGDYEKSERTEIVALARALGVDDQQLAAIEECARAVRDAAKQEAGGEHAHAKENAEKLAQRLAAVGIPVGIVGTLSAVGLTATGAASGLGALALGLGVASGFGAVLGLTVGTALGVRWLHDKICEKTG